MRRYEYCIGLLGHNKLFPVFTGYHGSYAIIIYSIMLHSVLLNMDKGLKTNVCLNNLPLDNLMFAFVLQPTFGKLPLTNK